MKQIEKAYRLRKNGNGALLRISSLVLSLADINPERIQVYQDGKDIVLSSDHGPGSYIGEYKLTKHYIRITESFLTQFGLIPGETSMVKFLDEKSVPGKRVIRLAVVDLKLT